MSFRSLSFALAVGVLAAGCTAETRTVVVPTAVVEDSCAYYGYAPGTEAYRICREREAAARARGRMGAGYAEARIAVDAQDACSSYGLVRGTMSYDRCVQREAAYRRPA